MTHLNEKIVEPELRAFRVDEGTRRRLRRELFEAIDEGEFEDVFAEIRSQTGPRHPDGSLKRGGGPSTA